MPQIKVQNQYRGLITSTIAASGDISFTVSVAPLYTNGFIVVSPDLATQREVMYFDNVIGNTIYVKGVNRTSPKSHAISEAIQINDVAEIFNTFSDMISQAFYVEKTGGLNVKVWGGYVLYNGAQVSVADTNLALADNTTNYIKYTFNTNTISGDTSNTGNIKAVVTTLSGVITSIVYRFSKESLIDFTVTLTGALPDQSGNAGKSLITDGTNVSWGINNNLRTSQGASFQTYEVDSVTGNEVKKSVGVGTTFGLTETLRKRKADGTYEEITPSILATTLGLNVQETNFESIIAANDIVSQTPDGIYKFQQAVKTSSALGGTNTYLDHCQVSIGKYLILYAVGGNMTAVVATLSSADVMTYGTPLNLGASATPTGKVALINTNKVIAVYAATASTIAVNVILTISGTSVTAGTPLNESQAANVAITSVCKVRTDCYAYCFGVGTSPSGIKVNTVSGTTITAGTVLATFAFGFTQNTVAGSYLSDNLISFSEGITNGSNLTNVKIYAITGGSTTVATTYTGTVTGQGSYYHARYSDTEVILTNSGTTEKSIFTIPGAGTTLVKTTLTANGAINYPVTPLFTNIYAINTGTTILIYQRDILIGTIASTPAYNTQSIQYDNGRIIFFNGATLISTIVNLCQVFPIGVAINATGAFKVAKSVATRTGVIRGYNYYLQSDGTISNGIGLTNTVLMTQLFGRGVLTDIIRIE